MKVQTVTVEIHEKRAHPSAMGHYDAKVEYTAEVDENDDPDNIVQQLQFVARQQVADECDRWVTDIRIKEEQSRVRNDLEWMITRTESGNVYPGDADEFAAHLIALPDSEQAGYRAKLETAKGQYIAEIKKRLDEWIARAENGILSSRQKERFDEDAALLGEIERQTYLERMEGALAPKAMLEGEDNSQ